MSKSLNILSKLEQFYSSAKANRWHWIFSIFCRVVLALAFIPAGLTKIMDERFASGLSANHPMGQFLEALHHTGYYYYAIGIAQVTAAILLLIPRTVVLGALLYLPIIINICILSFAMRFDGSLVTAPLMLLANLYILFWNYDSIKHILPFKKSPNYKILERPKKYSNKFPILFFAGVTACIAFFIFIYIYGYNVMPRNSLSECKKQFENTINETAGIDFCECIHINGNTLNNCLMEYKTLKND